MRVRDAVLAYQETKSDTATPTIDLDITDPISALVLEVECTNGATSNLGNYIADIVSKIEVVDGSETLVSLSMSQLQALQYYKTGKPPLMFFSEYAGGAQRGGAMILFGRYLWDRQYCLIPTRYRNPQLKITFNKAAIRAASATGFATGDNIKLTVVAKVIEDGAAPVGFLSAKEINSFTGAVSGEKRIDLPTDYPYRMLMLRAWYQGYDVDELISDLKLTADMDRYIMLNRKVKQLDAEVLELLGEITWQHHIMASNGDTKRTVLNKEPRIVPINSIADVFRRYSTYFVWSSQYYINVLDTAGAAVGTDEQVWTLQQGHALHATVPVMFGLMDQPDTWLDPRKWSKLEAVLTQATIAGGAISVVLEQLRP